MNFYPEDDDWEIRKMGFSDIEIKEISAACETVRHKGHGVSPLHVARVMSRSAINSKEVVRQFVELLEARYAQIKSAIELKQTLEIHCHGGIREVCPHVLGYSGGTACLTFYQIGGHAKYHPVGWMTVRLEHMMSISPSSAAWITPHDYRTSPLTKEIKDRRVWI